MAGNLILLELEIEKRFTINLINIYGPNQDSPKFYSDLSGYISDSSNDFTLICGDFNLVQDFNLDCSNYKSLNNPRARLELLNANAICGRNAKCSLQLTQFHLICDSDLTQTHRNRNRITQVLCNGPLIPLER